MSLRLKLHVCLLVLLLAVAFPVSSVGDCYETVMGVPQWCSGEFIMALFADNKDGVSRECCIVLACVREWACADVLRGFCLPPEAGECPVSGTA